VSQEPLPAEIDVLIVGAGISGIAAAVHLQNDCPDIDYAIVDTEDHFGGTWWTHKFPGIRSDSDLHTFGYQFKPWTGTPIATAEAILEYMGEVIDEHDLDRRIRYRSQVVSADWSEQDQRWQVSIERLDTGETTQVSTRFLYMCQGYYRHRQGFLPEWPGMDDFAGEIVHCEEWTDDVDYADKRVIVIGSGATAATVVPAMAGDAAHVTMLQRSPTYFRTGRNQIELAVELRTLGVDEDTVHDITRRKMTYESSQFTARCFEEPAEVKQELIGIIRELVGDEVDVDTHFTPSYDPWTQRIAFVPDADLFNAIKAGDVSVVTGHIERFEAEGIRLTDGRLIEADLIAAATGFNMSVMGDIDFAIDGKSLDWHDTVTYRGTMFTGVPNLAWVFGYFRSSWTLRSELIANFVCRLLNHMDEHGYGRVEAELRPHQRDLAPMDWIDERDFNPAYLKRAAHLLPQRLDDLEWQHSQDYWREKDEFPKIALDDGVFAYRTALQEAASRA
jgi:cation diffusion facilitator CzcD-associated flavoprotein CzcO